MKKLFNIFLILSAMAYAGPVAAQDELEAQIANQKAAQQELTTLGDEAEPDDFNLHLIDQNPNGFQIYRMAKPGNSKEAKYLCQTLGVTEVYVMSGNGAETEGKKFAAECPNLKIIYDVEQSPKIPVTKDFLAQFDSWVQEAQASGKKIAFRCDLGAHRTGRLAAYYQMKYQRLTWQDANVILRKYGRFMIFHTGLDNQVRALEDYIYNRPCSEQSKYCPN